jgi:hypothetical protein
MWLSVHGSIHAARNLVCPRQRRPCSLLPKRRLAGRLASQSARAKPSGAPPRFGRDGMPAGRRSEGKGGGGPMPRPTVKSASVPSHGRDRAIHPARRAVARGRPSPGPMPHVRTTSLPRHSHVGNDAYLLINSVNFIKI